MTDPKPTDEGTADPDGRYIPNPPATATEDDTAEPTAPKPAKEEGIVKPDGRYIP